MSNLEELKANNKLILSSTVDHDKESQTTRVFLAIQLNQRETKHGET